MKPIMHIIIINPTKNGTSLIALNLPIIACIGFVLTILSTTFSLAISNSFLFPTSAAWLVADWLSLDFLLMSALFTSSKMSSSSGFATVSPPFFIYIFYGLLLLFLSFNTCFVKRFTKSLPSDSPTYSYESIKSLRKSIMSLSI